MAHFLVAILSMLLVANIVLCKPISSSEDKKTGNELSAIEQQLATSEQDGDEDDICIICHDDFLESPPVTLMCGHKYHYECLRSFEEVTGKLTKCFTCMKPSKLLGSQMDIGELFRKEEREIVIRNKLKLGMMAGYKHLPGHWNLLPRTWHERDIYHPAR